MFYNIVMNFDPFIFDSSSTETKHYLPTFLYDNNPLNDVNYLYNFSILKKYTLNSVHANLHNEIPEIDTLFVWEDDGVKRGKKFVLEHYNRPNKTDIIPNTDITMSLAKENINLLLPYFDSMKNTEFFLFFSPFSIAYWDEQYRLNKIDMWKSVYLEICKILVNYDNVHLLFWTDDNMMTIITNLENYKDTAHYVPEICPEIVDRINNLDGKLTPKNYIGEINKFFDYIIQYDYQQIFN